MSSKAQFVPVVAVLNMKGGVGKTTITAHVFREVYERKRLETLLIDLDPQFNLTQTLFTRDGYEKIKSEGKTILSVMEPVKEPSMFEVSATSSPPPDVSTVHTVLRHFRSAPSIILSVIAGDFGMAKYSLMDDNKKLLTIRNRFLTFIDRAKGSYKMVCIDCNPSSSFLTLCALRACTHILVPIRPDRYSILGLEMLHQFVEDLPTISPKPQFVVMLNGMPRRSQSGADQIESELRSHSLFGSRTLVRPLHESGLLRARSDYTGFASDKGGSWSVTIRKEIRAIADELAPKLGV